MIIEELRKEDYARQIGWQMQCRMSETERAVPIGVSNRHIHLSRKDMDTLFGLGSELTKKNDLLQIGQYAAEETVTLRGEKGTISKVRVLGPLRAETQVEISVADGFTLGVKPPVRDSGDLDGSPGILVEGPAGSVKLEHGVIVAKRHIHMSLEDAEKYHVHDNQLISVRAGGERGGILENVLVRVSDRYAFEMHIDLEEANALKLSNRAQVYMILPPKLI